MFLSKKLAPAQIQDISSTFCTVKLSFSLIKSEPIFLLGQLLQHYLCAMTIKDGLLLFALAKQITCLSQKSLLYTHGTSQLIDISALVFMAIAVCMKNHHGQLAQDDDQSNFYAISKMNVIVSLTFSVFKSFAVLYLLFYCVFSRRLIREKAAESLA